MSSVARYTGAFTPAPLSQDVATLALFDFNEGSGASAEDGVSGRMATVSGATWSAVCP